MAQDFAEMVYEFIPTAAPNDEGTWFPSVKMLVNGKFLKQEVYLVEFEDYAQAVAEARVFAEVEQKRVKQTIEAILNEITDNQREQASATTG